MYKRQVIALVILFVVGPKRLPDVAKSIGKGYGEFKRTLNEMKQSVNMDDNNVQYSKRKTQTEDKTKTYAEQYRSQWDDKFDTEAPIRTSKIEQEAIKNNEDKG